MTELAHLLDLYLAARNLPCARPGSDGAFTFDAGDGLAVCASAHQDGSLELVANPGYLSATELEAVIEDDERRRPGRRRGADALAGFGRRVGCRRRPRHGPGHPVADARASPARSGRLRDSARNHARSRRRLACTPGGRSCDHVDARPRCARRSFAPREAAHLKRRPPASQFARSIPQVHSRRPMRTETSRKNATYKVDDHVLLAPNQNNAPRDEQIEVQTKKHPKGTNDAHEREKTDRLQPA